jgi:PIN domain nuclease of toxin-antitoxin system
MNLLLDSHAFIWWIGDDAQLGPEAREAIEVAEKVYVSVVSVWELGIKKAAGKIAIEVDLSVVAEESGFEMLDCRLAHAQLAPMLPLHHKDPFDRMLIAQAMVEQLYIVSQDGAFAPYEVDVVNSSR